MISTSAFLTNNVDNRFTIISRVKKIKQLKKILS